MCYNDNNKVTIETKNTLITDVNKFNENIEFTQYEHRDVIKTLKQFLKKLYSKFLENEKMNPHTLDAINKLLITVNDSINLYHNNTLSLLSKLVELNGVLNPTENDNSTDEDDEILKEFKKDLDEQLKRNDELLQQHQEGK